MANPSVHYIGADVGTLNDHNRCIALWEGIKRQHLQEYGPNTAYNFSICNDHALFFVGRGWDRDSAANGVDDDPEIENLGSRALLVMVGPNDEITLQCQNGIRAWANDAVDNHGMSWPLRGHKTYVATSCPGDKLMEVIREINLNHGGSTPPETVYHDEDFMIISTNENPPKFHLATSMGVDQCSQELAAAMVFSGASWLKNQDPLAVLGIAIEIAQARRAGDTVLSRLPR